MEGKISLNLAMSLDGYICDENGGYQWIHGDGTHELKSASKWSHEEYLNEIDLVVMGRRCYEQGMHLEFNDKEVWIATSKPLPASEGLHAAGKELCSQVLDEKQKGRNIYLYGGGVTIDPFIKQDLIDEYIIGIIPVILGCGKPLFLGNNFTIELRLKDCIYEEGIVILRYVRH